MEVQRWGFELVRMLRLNPRGTRVVAVTCSAEPLARYVAEAFGVQPELLRIARIRLPGDERPIGALDDEGRVCITSDDCHLVTPLLVARAVDRGRAEISLLPKPIEPLASWVGQAVVLVDDVSATGSAMVVAARRARDHQAALVVAAVGRASAAAMQRMRAAADEVFAVEVQDRLVGKPTASVGGPEVPRRRRSRRTPQRP